MNRAYRDALSCFATGVTVVSAHHDAQDWGMTCNSFSSVSLEPRLVLWSIRQSASSRAAFVSAGGYTVSVLSDGQQALAGQFSTGDMAQRFAGVAADRLASGRLRLAGSSAWFDCALVQVIPAGDHDILLGEVRDFGRTTLAPLIYTQGQFLAGRQLASCG
jgi:3-hydroxy-9,10-secoandrosta-1,3,5(10)-triene-9,17-dione monooxygenase reductase component